MKFKTPILLAAATAAALALTACANAVGPAQSDTSAAATGLPDPQTPISFIVPTAAGGAGDTIARILAPYIEKTVGTKVQVINVDGAGGQLGIGKLAQAKPDGHTIGFTNIPTVIGLYTDPARGATFKRDSFTPLAQLTTNYLSVAVNASSPYKTFGDLIAAAKAKPGTITWATGGPLTNDHLAAVDVENKTGTDFNIVHLDGGAAKTTALLGNKVEVITGTGDAIVTQYQAKTIRVITILGPEKQDSLPETPTSKSLGYDITQPSGFFVSGPAGMPANVTTLLENAIATALKDTALIAQMAKLGYVPNFAGSAAFGTFWADQDAAQQPLILQAVKQG